MRIEWALLVGATFLCSAACGDEDSGSGGSGAASSSTGMGGTSNVSSANAGGTANTGGAGGTGGGTEEGLNGCTAATAEDHTGDATTTVTSMGFAYSPKCIRIKAGSSVTVNSDFVSHPIVGGKFANGTKTPDAASPITSTTSGMTATFTFPNAGEFGYYCDMHAGFGMTGAVFVE